MENRLSRVISSKHEYERLRRKVEELEALAERVTLPLSPLPKGGGSNLVDENWAKLIDYKNKCAWLLVLYEAEARELEEELECIRNPNIRTAMKYRYIDDLTVEEIAERMSYSTRNIDRFLNTGRRIYYGYYPT